MQGWFWRTYPRSGFRSGGTCERTLVPVFVPGEHLNVPSFRFSFRGYIRQNHPFRNHPFVNPREKAETRLCKSTTPFAWAYLEGLCPFLVPLLSSLTYHNHKNPFQTCSWPPPKIHFPHLRRAKTCVLKKDTQACRNASVLKTLACRKNVGGFFKHW